MTVCLQKSSKREKGAQQYPSKVWMALSGQALVNSISYNDHIQLHEAVPLHDKPPSDILQIMRTSLRYQ
jgi:hypothetical protein